MSNVLKIVTLAVGLIIVAALIANVVSIYTTGKNLLDLGKSSLGTSTEAFVDIDKTQYEDSTVNGAQVIDLIKNYWTQDNTIAILVCTKDGARVMYDYTGQTYAIRNDLTGYPSTDATNQTLSGNVDSLTLVSLTNKGTEHWDQNTGYKDTATNSSGSINRGSGIFKGKVQSDVNGNIRCLTFIQQS